MGSCSRTRETRHGDAAGRRRHPRRPREREAVRIPIDFWFGAGAFDRLPTAVTDAMPRGAAMNARDVRASFREQYDQAALAALSTPIGVFVGERSPRVTHVIGKALAALAPSPSYPVLEGADHGMLSSNADAVARAIAATAQRAARLDQRVR